MSEKNCQYNLRYPLSSYRKHADANVREQCKMFRKAFTKWEQKLT